MDLFNVLFYGTAIYCFILFVYSLYKLIWYHRRMKWFRQSLEEFSADGVKIEYFGKFSDIYRGKRGVPHFTVTTPKGIYEVSVLSHPSTHGRWIIEETMDGHVFEVRTRRRIIFVPYHNTGTEPYHSKEHRREARLYRDEFVTAPPDPSYTKQILLLYPEPMAAAYAHHRYDELFDGTRVCDREVMFVERFYQMIQDDIGGSK